ncbi:hypothetical protein [Geomonas azotofigens]|uniref:hypothetical protein n=1 Tax=Geomonas azotofigens TaxID=2843196 RepID=UPI001C12349B|nr:hypothetical protein [Geomonas azotofigens]MBU5614088.1 hypothetical protein [Geomonas azotofigens]
MKRNLHRIAENLIMAAIALGSICTASWAGPPPPPSIPSTPVGNAEMSAVTMVAVAAYGFWKMRK